MRAGLRRISKPAAFAAAIVALGIGASALLTQPHTPRNEQTFSVATDTARPLALKMDADHAAIAARVTPRASKPF